MSVGNAGSQDRPDAVDSTTKEPTKERLYLSMTAVATRRDRLCFASHDTLAEMAGCSRRTVIRLQKQLEAEGRIVRHTASLPSGQRWRTCCWEFPVGQRRLPRKSAATRSRRVLAPPGEASSAGNDGGPVAAEPRGAARAHPLPATQRGLEAAAGARRFHESAPLMSHNSTSCRKASRSKGCCVGRSKTSALTGRRAQARVHGRRRRLVEQPELFPNHDLVVRKDGQVTRFNAGDAVAAVVDICALDGLRLTPRVKARLGRQAKEILEAPEGFSPEEVVTAMVDAVRRGRIDLVDDMLLKREVVRARGALTPLSAPPIDQIGAPQISPYLLEALRALERIEARRPEPQPLYDWGKLHRKDPQGE